MKKVYFAFMAFFLLQNFPAYAGQVIVEGGRVAQGTDGVIRITNSSAKVTAAVPPKALPVERVARPESSGGNHGLIQAGNVHEGGYPASRAQEAVSGNNFADREVWRSGVAGTFSMWGELISRAMPSNEGFPEKKKTGPRKKTLRNPMALLENIFSWSKSRDEQYRDCQRKYFYDKYASWGGWDKTSPEDIRMAYILKNLKNRWAWKGESVHHEIEDVLKLYRGGKPVPFAEACAKLT